MNGKHFAIAIAVIALLSALRVAHTHRVFAQTNDEPVHVAAGYDWLVKHEYILDLEHPPLARVLAALPFTAGPKPSSTDWVQRGNDLLVSEGQYEENLARARRGNLLFLVLAIIAVALWAATSLGRYAALLAALLFASSASILAHAGLATTDIAAAATVPFALYRFDRWLAERSAINAAWLGLAVGVGLASKFSFLAFFPAGAAIVFLSWTWRSYSTNGLKNAFVNEVSTNVRTWHQYLLAAGIAVLVVWAAYRFDVAPIAPVKPDDPRLIPSSISRVVRNPVTWFTQSVPIPAPRFVHGIALVRAHSKRGHYAYLFDQWSPNGWWYYFPVALFFKTAIALFVLAAIGCFLRPRSAIAPVCILLAILAVAMTARINIGVRHILPVYAPLCIAAAAGVAGLWRRGRGSQAFAVGLVLWVIGGSLAAHPDYLPWFNEAGGRNPQRILSDSNFDWGQDLLRLRRVCEEENITELNTQLFTSARLGDIGFPPTHHMDWIRPPTGWIAISEFAYVANGGDLSYGWLLHTPYRRVGKSVRLYYLKPRAEAKRPPGGGRSGVG